MCAPMPLLALLLYAGVVLADAESSSPMVCKDDCLRRLFLFENELNSIKAATSNLLPPKEPSKLSSLYEVYQQKYLDSKRDVNRNFQTQGWK